MKLVVNEPTLCRPTREADVGDRAVGHAQQRRGALEPAGEQVLVRRLAERAPELAAEVRAREAGGGGHVVDVERVEEARVGEVLGAQQVAGGRCVGHVSASRRAGHRRGVPGSPIARRSWVPRPSTRSPSRDLDLEAQLAPVGDLEQPRDAVHSAPSQAPATCLMQTSKPTVGRPSARCSAASRAAVRSIIAIIPGVERTRVGSVPPTSVSSPSSTVKGSLRSARLIDVTIRRRRAPPAR